MGTPASTPKCGWICAIAAAVINNSKEMPAGRELCVARKNAGSAIRILQLHNRVHSGTAQLADFKLLPVYIQRCGLRSIDRTPHAVREQQSVDVT